MARVPGPPSLRQWGKGQWGNLHSESLVLLHDLQVVHREVVLCPVLEDCTVATVGDQLVWELRNLRIKIVLNHQHDPSGLAASEQQTPQVDSRY